MKRIDTNNAVDGKFVAGDAERNPTFLSASWLNSLQEEIAGYIESQGLTLDPNDEGQLRKAIELHLLQGGGPGGTSVTSGAGLSYANVLDYGAGNASREDDDQALADALADIADGKKSGLLIPYFSGGLYFSDLTLPHSISVIGEGWRKSIIRLTHEDAALRFNSSNVVKDLMIVGGGVAKVGICEVGTMNRTVLKRIRVEGCTEKNISIGEVGQVNNSFFESIFSQNSPINYRVANALNTTFLDCNGNLRDEENGGLNTDRNILIGYAESAGAGNDTARNVIFYKGIYERGVPDHCVEVMSNAGVIFDASEFNAGKISTIEVSGGVVLRNPHFTLDGQNLATSGSGHAEIEGQMIVSGREGRGDNVLFKSSVSGLKGDKFDLRTQAYGVKTHGESTAVNLPDGGVQISNVSASSNNRIGLSGDKISNGGDANTMYEIIVNVSSITSGSPSLLYSLEVSPWRTYLGPLVEGENRYVIKPVAGFGGALEILSGSTIISAVINSFSIKIV